MVNQPGEGGDKARRRQRFQRPLPQTDTGIDLRFLRQLVIQLRLVGMMQDVHHVGSADARRVVNPGVGITAFFKLSHPLLGHLQHLFLRTEVDRAGRTGFHAGRFLADADPIHAQGAFIDPVILFIEARDVKRTPRNAVAAADAVFLLEIDDAVGVLNNRPGGWAGLQAARLCAVHTAILADKPLQFAVLFGLAKTHYRPGFGAEIRRVVVHPDAVPHVIADVIPLGTGHLAGFTAHAGGDIDKLGDFRFIVPRARRGGDRVGRGAFNNVLGFHRH